MNIFIKNPDNITFQEILDCARKINFLCILLYEGEYDGWKPHPDGVIIERKDQLLLNGQKLLYEGEYDGWKAHPDGVIIPKENQLLLNGEKILYEGEYDGWRPHPDGVIIERKDRLLLNGQKLLYEGKFHAWKPHPDGVIIERENQLLLNGEKILSQGNNITWISRSKRIDQIKNKFSLNGKILYEGEYDAWKPHTEGIVIQKGNQFCLYLKGINLQKNLVVRGSVVTSPFLYLFSPTTHFMIVDLSCSLEMCIHDCRSDKFHSKFFEIFTNLFC